MATPKTSHLPCGRPLPKRSESADQTLSLLDKMKQRLETYCTERSLNRTEAREKILETIVYEARHFTALDLLTCLQKRHPEIGKATVYRNLPILTECGAIQEGPTDPEGQAHFELADDDHHDHIVCTDCRQIFEFHDETIEKRQDQVVQKLGFSPQGHRHVVFAKCSYLESSRKKVSR